MVTSIIPIPLPTSVAVALAKKLFPKGSSRPGSRHSYTIDFPSFIILMATQSLPIKVDDDDGSEEALQAMPDDKVEEVDDDDDSDDGVGWEAEVLKGVCRDVACLYRDKKQCQEVLGGPVDKWKTALNVFRVAARLHVKCDMYRECLKRARSSGTHLGRIVLPIPESAYSPDCDGAVTVWSNVFEMVFVIGETTKVQEPWDGFGRKSMFIRDLIPVERAALLAEILRVLSSATKKVGWQRDMGDQPYRWRRNPDDCGESNPLEATAWFFCMVRCLDRMEWDALLPLVYGECRFYNFSTEAIYLAYKEATMQHLGIVLPSGAHA